MIKNLRLTALTIILLGFYRLRLLINLAIFFVTLWLVLFITTISYSYYKNISVNEWKVLKAWVGSYFYIGRREYQEVTYQGKFGFEKTINIEVFEKDKYVAEVLFRFTELLKRSIVLSILNEIVVIIALLTYFKLQKAWKSDGLYKKLPSDSYSSYRSGAEYLLIQQYIKMKKLPKQEELPDPQKAEPINIEEVKSVIKAKETQGIIDSKDLVDSSHLEKIINIPNNTKLSISEKTLAIKRQNVLTEDY